MRFIGGQVVSFRIADCFVHWCDQLPLQLNAQCNWVRLLHRLQTDKYWNSINLFSAKILNPISKLLFFCLPVQYYTRFECLHYNTLVKPSPFSLTQRALTVCRWRSQPHRECCAHYFNVTQFVYRLNFDLNGIRSTYCVRIFYFFFCRAFNCHRSKVRRWFHKIHKHSEHWAGTINWTEHLNINCYWEMGR